MDTFIYKLLPDLQKLICHFHTLKTLSFLVVHKPINIHLRFNLKTTLNYNILIINRKCLWRGKHHRLIRYTKFYALILLLLNSSDKCLSALHMLQRYILYLNSIEKMSLANLYSRNKRNKILCFAILHDVQLLWQNFMLHNHSF